MKKNLNYSFALILLTAFAISCDDNEDPYTGPCRLAAMETSYGTSAFEYNEAGQIERFPLQWIGTDCSLAMTYFADGSLATRRFSCSTSTLHESTFTYPETGKVVENYTVIFFPGQPIVRTRTYFYSEGNRIDSMHVTDQNGTTKIYLTYKNGNLFRYLEDGTTKIELFNINYDDKVSIGRPFREATGNIPLTFWIVGDFYFDPSLHSMNNATSYEWRRYRINNGNMDIDASNAPGFQYTYTVGGMPVSVTSPGTVGSTGYVYQGCN